MVFFIRAVASGKRVQWSVRGPNNELAEFPAAAEGEPGRPAENGAGPAPTPCWPTGPLVVWCVGCTSGGPVRNGYPSAS
jgi:hypothetical protein